MNDEANKLIGEVLGAKRECRASQLYRVEECGTGLEDCDNCKHNRYPDYCGNDHDALDAIKELRAMGLDVAINLSCTGATMVSAHKPVWREQITSGTAGIPKVDNPISAALMDAMVEDVDEPLLGQRPDVIPKMERIVRLRPAIEAALAEEEKKKK